MTPRRSVGDTWRRIVAGAICAMNFRCVLFEARTPYFMWAAGDDLRAATFIAGRSMCFGGSLSSPDRTSLVAQWTGSASDFLQAGTSRSGWPKSPRALAGRLCRAQTFLSTLGIEIEFGREGRLGTRTITITAAGESRSLNNVSTVSIVSRVSDNGCGGALSCADDADG